MTNKKLIELYSDRDIELFIKYKNDFLKFKDQIIFVHYAHIPFSFLTSFESYFIDLTKIYSEFNVLCKELNIPTSESKTCKFTDERWVLLRNIAKQLNARIYPIETFLNYNSEAYREHNQ